MSHLGRHFYFWEEAMKTNFLATAEMVAVMGAAR